MRSALTWFLTLAGGTFALLWLTVSVVLLVLVLVAVMVGRQA
jgi:hypothetical protein